MCHGDGRAAELVDGGGPGVLLVHRDAPVRVLGLRPVVAAA